jgi:hypothetical protein
MGLGPEMASPRVLCKNRMTIPHFAGRKFPTLEAYKAASLASDAVDAERRLWRFGLPLRLQPVFQNGVFTAVVPSAKLPQQHARVPYTPARIVAFTGLFSSRSVLRQRTWLLEITFEWSCGPNRSACRSPGMLIPCRCSSLALALLAPLASPGTSSAGVGSGLPR